MRTDRAGGIRRRARIKPPAVNFSVYFPLRLPRPRLSNPKTWVRMPRQGDSPTAIPTVDFLNRPDRAIFGSPPIRMTDQCALVELVRRNCWVFAAPAPMRDMRRRASAAERKEEPWQ